MISKAFNNFKSKVACAAASVQSTSHYTNVAKEETHGLPLAQKSAFRKRPAKLSYDPNEYHMFRLPSENSFLLSGFDKDEIFGKRKGIQHSPHIKAQTDLDSNMLWGLAAFCLIMAAYEVGPHQRFKTLRENYRNSDMGKFTEKDFK